MSGARDPLVTRFSSMLIDSRRLNAGPGPQTRDTVRKSYEFALNHVGQDKDSGEIWSDFIQFLKSADVCCPSCSSDALADRVLPRIGRYDVGGATENGRPPESVSPCGTDTFGQCRTTVAGTRNF